MLLVHDDKSERFNWCKDCRARADHDACATLPNLVPLVVSLTAAQMRMQHGDERLQFPRTKSRLESLHRLRRERDFRHEHNRALPLLQRVRDGLEINFCFARAGDTVEEEGG